MTHAALPLASLHEPSAIPPEAVAGILRAGAAMHARGWVPATAGNISVRLDAERVAITRSGVHKGHLVADDVIEVDLEGRPVLRVKPSAETGLHCQLYRLLPQVGAVLHGHSVAATVLSMHTGDAIRFADYEILKAFEGQTTHATAVDLPVFDNDQDIPRLAAKVEPAIRAGLPLGYLIRGHGVYIWGPSIDAALWRLEGLEFLLACELERRKLVR